MNLVWLKPLILKTQGFLVKNAPQILMTFGTAGSITSLIFAGQATPKAKEAVKAATDEKGSGLTIWEKTKAGGKYYIPALGMEIFSLGCFWGAHGINVKRQAVLAGLYSTAEAAFKEYQKKVVDMIGDKTEKEIRKSVSQDLVDNTPPPRSLLDDTLEKWCLFDGEYFPTSYQKMKDIQNVANHELIQTGYLSKGDLKWMLDPEHKHLHSKDDDDMIGWTSDKLMEFDIDGAVEPFRHQPVLTLSIRDKDGFNYEPKARFNYLY